MADFYLIAEIEQPAGKSGFVRIIPVSDFPERFLKLKKVFLDFWGDKKPFAVSEVKKHQENFLLKFKNFNSIRDSQVLIGRKIFIDDRNVVRLPKNHFFIHDLIDVNVFIKDEKIGVVTDVLKLPANDVLVVKKNDSSEQLIPFVLEFIEKFQPKKKKLSLRIDKDFFEEDEN
ncbi:MAG: ribosome maturation factor RimM [Ignavibacteria bacterium]|nr:ribosome maturation factor RimM [Ignavibacteria bacterium]